MVYGGACRCASVRAAETHVGVQRPVRAVEGVEMRDYDTKCFVFDVRVPALTGTFLASSILTRAMLRGASFEDSFLLPAMRRPVPQSCFAELWFRAIPIFRGQSSSEQIPSYILVQYSLRPSRPGPAKCNTIWGKRPSSTCCRRGNTKRSLPLRTS